MFWGHSIYFLRKIPQNQPQQSKLLLNLNTHFCLFNDHQFLKTHFSRGNSHSLSSGMSYSDPAVSSDESRLRTPSILTCGTNGAMDENELGSLYESGYRIFCLMTMTRFLIGWSLVNSGLPNRFMKQTAKIPNTTIHEPPTANATTSTKLLSPDGSVSVNYENKQEQMSKSTVNTKYKY